MTFYLLTVTKYKYRLPSEEEWERAPGEMMVIFIPGVMNLTLKSAIIEIQGLTSPTG